MSERFLPSPPVSHLQGLNNPTGCGQEAKASPIVCNSDALFNSLDQLDKHLAELASRITHVLTPQLVSPPEPTINCSPKGHGGHGSQLCDSDRPESTIAAQFRSATDRVSAAASKLQALSFLVEL